MFVFVHNLMRFRNSFDVSAGTLELSRTEIIRSKVEDRGALVYSRVTSKETRMADGGTTICLIFPIRSVEFFSQIFRNVICIRHEPSG